MVRRTSPTKIELLISHWRAILLLEIQSLFSWLIFSLMVWTEIECVKAHHAHRCNFLCSRHPPSGPPVLKFLVTFNVCPAKGSTKLGAYLQLKHELSWTRSATQKSSFHFLYKTSARWVRYFQLRFVVANGSMEADGKNRKIKQMIRW